MAEMPLTPALDEMIAVSEDSQKIGEFLDWLQCSEDGAGLVLAQWEHRIECRHARVGRYPRPGYLCINGVLKWDDNSGPVLDDDGQPEQCDRCDGKGWIERSEPVLIPAAVGIEALLARYFDIDLAAADRERQAVLRAIQEDRYGD